MSDQMKTPTQEAKRPQETPKPADRPRRNDSQSDSGRTGRPKQPTNFDTLRVARQEGQQRRTSPEQKAAPGGREGAQRAKGGDGSVSPVDLRRTADAASGEDDKRALADRVSQHEADLRKDSGRAAGETPPDAQAQDDGGSPGKKGAREPAPKGGDGVERGRSAELKRAKHEYDALRKDYEDKRQALMTAEKAWRDEAANLRDHPPRDASGNPVADSGFPAWFRAEDRAQSYQNERENLSHHWEEVEAKYRAVAFPQGAITRGDGLDSPAPQPDRLAAFNKAADALKSSAVTPIVASAYALYTEIKNGSAGPMTPEQRETMYKIAEEGARIEHAAVAFGVAGAGVGKMRGPDMPQGGKTDGTRAGGGPVAGGPRGSDTNPIPGHELIRHEVETKGRHIPADVARKTQGTMERAQPGITRGREPGTYQIAHDPGSPYAVTPDGTRTKVFGQKTEANRADARNAKATKQAWERWNALNPTGPQLPVRKKK
jgi:hypothetical protein